MDITDVANVLNTHTRVRLLRLVTQQPLTSSEAHQIYTQKYSSPTRRESIYRELEKLAETKLVAKEYQNEQKQLVYFGTTEEIQIDIVENKVRLISVDE